MKKILFDLVPTQPNSSGKRHGGGKYAEMIFNRMIERRIVFDCLYDSRKWINPNVENAARNHGCLLHNVADEDIKCIVEGGKYTNLFSALPSRDILNITCCDVFVTLHGLRKLETPFDSGFWYYKHSYRDGIKWIIGKIFPKYIKKRSMKQFEDYFISQCHLITVSEHTMAAIKAYFPQNRKPVKVFFSPNTSSVCPAKKTNKKSRYFLMVSGNRWEKNNLRAIIAFDRLVSAGLLNGYRAVVTGCVPGMYLKRIKNISCFDFMGYVDDNKLEELYVNAFCFVYPSLNEGFGYPPLEAMRYGIPVIASPLSSISELLEGAALYFNPFSIEEIMNRMILISDPIRYEEYSKAGIAKYTQIKQRQERDLEALIDYIIT